MAEPPSPATGRPRFQQLQYAFAAHLRDPEHQPGPAGIEDRRLRIYRELFFNNVEGFLANAFPVLHQLTDTERWQALVRDFYARHRCQDPLFNGLAEEFLRYLQDERAPPDDDPPWLLELAHYEWVELALSIADESLDPVLADPNGDLLAGPPCLSPLAWPLVYEYPVHRIGPEFQPERQGEQPTCLVVYRCRQDEVRFLEINLPTARLLELTATQPAASGRELLLQVATELGQGDQPGPLLAAGAGMLQGLRQRDILLGTRRA